MTKLIAHWLMIGGLWWFAAPMFGMAALLAEQKGFGSPLPFCMWVCFACSFASLVSAYFTHHEDRDAYEEEKRFYKRGIEEKLEKAKREHDHMLRQQQDIINADRRREAAAAAKEHGMIEGEAKRRKRKEARGEMIYDPDTGEELGRLDIDALNREFFAEPAEGHFYGPWRLDKDEVNT